MVFAMDSSPGFAGASAPAAGLGPALSSGPKEWTGTEPPPTGAVFRALPPSTGSFIGRVNRAATRAGLDCRDHSSDHPLGRVRPAGAPRIDQKALQMTETDRSHQPRVRFNSILVKIGGMATVSLGPAFWELTLIVLIVALESTSLCEKTIWRMLETRSRS